MVLGQRDWVSATQRFWTRSRWRSRPSACRGDKQQSYDPNGASHDGRRVIVQRLAAWGVEWTNGYPGDGIDSIQGTLNCGGNRPEFMQASHAELGILAS